MRIVVIGGVAAGMSAASQAKRRRPDAEVVVLERGPRVSYGACGLPYNIADPERRVDDLVVISAERFRTERGIDVRTRHDALAIDTTKRIVRVRDLTAERDYELPYDRVVLATGASAVRPPLPGIDLPGVFVLRELTDGAAVKRWLAENVVRRAVIIGAGYIGMEMAEALRTRGLEVVVLEKLGQVVPGFDPTLAGLIEKELVKSGHAYPGSTPVTTVLFVERRTGRLLGAQMVGREGVAGRIDVLATALHARMTVAQIESLDLAYAPPLAPVYDPVLIAAGVARKDLRNP
jgi:NADPH-dependent 2,4-dienoyl-CoA reductase/sulfur reductase-like enzyme